ncbi:MAG TPA: hypothetical protein VKV25_07195 [Acidimicrobiales bacterium]|nr:hypothetical protein [Acidimicrobiales bacterium]
MAQLVPPAHRVRALMDAALMQPDCSQLAPGPDVLADPARVEVLLAGPAASPELHVALVQRYGRVGAWLVVGAAERAGGRGGGPAVRLVERFAGLDATGLTALLDELEPPGAGAGGHRLDATFAVAARDRSPGAHRAYMAALLSRRSA